MRLQLRMPMMKQVLTTVFILFIFTGYILGQEETNAQTQNKLTPGAIHEAALVLDTHVDIEGKDYATKKMDPGIDNPDLRCDLVKMKKGGVDGVFLAVYIGQKPEFDKNTYDKIYKKALDSFTAIKRLPQMYPERCQLALSPDDVTAIVKSGKLAIMIGMENGYPIGDSLDRLKEYYRLGARYITLSHSGHNQICDSSSQDNPINNGLSQFGKKVVKEMNRLGMMCDASHIAKKSFYDLLKESRAPVIASHSACFALTAHDRNLDDDQLKALTKNGGVIQIVAVSSFIESPAYTKAVEALRAEMKLPSRKDFYRMSKKERQALKPKMKELKEQIKELEKKIPAPDLNALVDHIDHAVKIAGIDHVGIGSDFDGGGHVPGFENHADAANITAELMRRGYSQEDINKIWGGNLMRVWRKVEAVARELQQKNTSSHSHNHSY